eukprot:CAMPEP_0197658034 /NCGR_PEP_ID=MMETSP1338-20131121/44990_1 /TAXON_ID=43686 ORGANISM="Pelagodinium beii, Strain RCC1491" /NCGR_SAMPLE_ID=MMETSP1338 /ASSEMBLY_ACC=CAM_ASM_000754 /LENGTH=291 /DNA_ID=CAMNT_0043234531 /DNA_START=80 /DNA_END=955 /DNA_ORIENTATION=-
MAASLETSFCTSADVVFQTKSLRSFLKHPGYEQSGGGFFKPSNPEHRPPSQAGGALSLRPFHAKDAGKRSDSRPTRQQLQQRGWRLNGRKNSPRASPRSTDAGSLTGSLNSSTLSASGVMDPEISIGLLEGGYTPSMNGKRRRPVHDSVVDGDPEKIPFSEEPDDARVLVPAHRIGDDPPASKPQKRAQLPDVRRRLQRSNDSIRTLQGGRASPRPLQKRASSSSAPELFLSVKQLPNPRAPPRNVNAGMQFPIQDHLGMAPTTAEQDALAQLFIDSPSSRGGPGEELLEP